MKKEAEIEKEVEKPETVPDNIRGIDNDYFDLLDDNNKLFITKEVYIEG